MLLKIMYYKIANQKEEKPDAFLIVKRRSVTKKSSSTKHSIRCKSKYNKIPEHIHDKNLSPSPRLSKLQDFTPTKNKYCKCCSETPTQKTRTNSIRQVNNQTRQQKNQLTVNRCPEPNHLCNYDKQMQFENKKLRQQNKCLNEYYNLFSKKYEEKCEQLRKIKDSRYFNTFQGSNPYSHQQHRQQQLKYDINNVYRLSKAQESDSTNPYSPLNSRRESPSFQATAI